jgi:hypothetical protein
MLLRGYSNLVSRGLNYLVVLDVVLLVDGGWVGVVDDGEGARTHVHPAAGQVLDTVLHNTALAAAQTKKRTNTNFWKSY